MLKITRKKVCPSCGVVDFTRKHRAYWMRLLRGSRLYQCRHCRDQILLWKDSAAAEEVRLEEV
jgi:hypothetical protein